MICVTSVSYKYSINVHQSECLKAKMGLGQGDPISPVLFKLIIEYMHIYLKKLKDQSNFNSHPKCEKLGITSICFADDLIFFTRGDEGLAYLMIQSFHKFSASSGLAVNPTK